MKLSTFMDNLNSLLASNPEASDYDVLTSSDDEGNEYNEVYFKPSLGNFDGEDFTNDARIEGGKPSVCLN